MFFGNANVNGFCLKKHISSLCKAIPCNKNSVLHIFTSNFLNTGCVSSIDTPHLKIIYPPNMAQNDMKCHKLNYLFILLKIGLILYLSYKKNVLLFLHGFKNVINFSEVKECWKLMKFMFHSNIIYTSGFTHFFINLGCLVRSMHFWEP